MCASILAQNSVKSYQYVWNCYVMVCVLYELAPFPSSENQLCLNLQCTWSSWQKKTLKLPQSRHTCTCQGCVTSRQRQVLLINLLLSHGQDYIRCPKRHQEDSGRESTNSQSSLPMGRYPMHSPLHTAMPTVRPN